MNITELYGDLTGTGSQTINLVNYAKNLDHSFTNKEFIAFRDTQYSYYLVWADNLELQNGKVVGNDIQYVRYYRTDNYNTYYYDYGTDTSFSLLPNYMTTSNIETVGFSCPTFEQYEYQNNLIDLGIFLLACLFVIAITNLRKVVTK